MQDHRKLTEQSTLINEISINTKQAAPLPASYPDAITAISYHVSYEEGLRAFRQTSKNMNELVEKSEAGVLARKAHDLEPHCVSKAAAAGVTTECTNNPKGFAALYGFVGGTAGTLAGVFTVGGSHLTGGALLMGAGASCASALTTYGLFKHKENVMNAQEEQKNIRQVLKQPLGMKMTP